MRVNEDEVTWREGEIRPPSAEERGQGERVGSEGGERSRASREREEAWFDPGLFLKAGTRS